MSRSVRWGRLSEIDRRIRIGSPAFKGQPKRLQQLMAWRGMHLVRNHSAIRSYARRRSIKPSSNLPLPVKINYFSERI